MFWGVPIVLKFDLGHWMIGMSGISIFRKFRVAVGPFIIEV